MDSTAICTLITELDSDHACCAVEERYMWNNGQTITVRLDGGTDHVRKKVKELAMEWLQYANLKMNFVEQGVLADIRVSFASYGGTWSALGTKCKELQEPSPTMNFSHLTDTSSHDEFSRSVLHEFGHALGCIHEHQNPRGNILWDKPKVYKHYLDTMGWSRSKVDRNIFEAYSIDTTNSSEFDPESIMLYAIPAELTLNNFSTRANTILSARDKSFIAEIYPPIVNGSGSNLWSID